MNSELASRIQTRLDSLTKPPGSLGKLEQLALRFGLIRGTAMPTIHKKVMYVFCADHGIAAEGVSAFPQAVTRQMVLNFLAGGAAINVLCRHHAIDPRIVDCGVIGPAAPGVINHKIAESTRNFAHELAMTRAQAEQAIAIGRDLARDCDILGAGEMGIGNTTCAATLLSAFTGLDPSETAGRGTGLTADALAHKTGVIRAALALHHLDPQDPIGVLAAVGGFEIGAITGLILGGAERGIPVMLDGFISCSAALVARAIEPKCLDAVFFSHRSAERGHKRMLEALNAEPLLDLAMRLGEGSGAALGIGLVEAAVKLYNEMATFSSAGVSS